MPLPADVGVVLLAAGASRRLSGSVRKPYLRVGGKPLLAWPLGLFAGIRQVRQIVLVARPEDRGRARRVVRGCSLRGNLRVAVVAGGRERPDSVERGLRALGPAVRWVAIHDAARPFVSKRLVRSVLSAARDCGGAIPALAAWDTLKRVEGGRIRRTVGRGGLSLAQTPQVFRKDLLIRAFAKRRGRVWTDDAMAFEAMGLPVAVVPGERSNLKVTAAEDLRWARFFLESAQDPPRGGR